MTNPALNPQGAQMADESMIRTLAAQIEAIWPQEKSLLNFYRLPRNARVLDVGAGTGEFSARVAALLPESQVLGVELLQRIRRRTRARNMRRSRRACSSRPAMRSRSRSRTTASTSSPTAM